MLWLQDHLDLVFTSNASETGSNNFNLPFYDIPQNGNAWRFNFYRRKKNINLSLVKIKPQLNLNWFLKCSLINRA